MNTETFDPKAAMQAGREWMSDKNNQKKVVKTSIILVVIGLVVAAVIWIIKHLFGASD